MRINSTNLSEEQVLKKLNIPDFRHLSKDKVMTFFSMLPNMDPEVAKKAIEQFPVYASAVKEIVSDYMCFINKVLSDNEESVQNYYECCRLILSSLSKMLEQEDLSFDDKKYIIDRMLEVESHIAKKDTENKRHRAIIVSFVSAVIVSVIGGLAVVLGGNSGTSLPNLDSDNDNNKEDSDDDEYGSVA
ncbi:MAG: hypothetical protein K6C13_02710 [Oscillospiraceae bacterium]|nr:hypothetical protein [Oscillospiraceae bacterium]